MGYNLQNTQCLQGDGDCQVYVWVNDVHFHKDAGYNFPDDEGYMTITIAFSKSIRNMALFNNIGTFNLALRTTINGTNVQDHNIPILIKRVTNVNEGGAVSDTSYYPQYRMYNIDDSVHNISSLSDRSNALLGKITGLKYIGDIANDGWTGSNLYDPEGAIQVRLKISKNPNYIGGASNSGFDSIFPARTPVGDSWTETDWENTCDGDPWFDDHVKCTYTDGYNNLTEGADIGGHPNTDHATVRYCDETRLCQDGLGEGWYCGGVTQPWGSMAGGYCDLTYWSRCMGERGCSSECFHPDTGEFNLDLCCTVAEQQNGQCPCTHDRYSNCSGYDLDPHTYLLAPTYNPTYGDIYFGQNCEEWGYPRSCGPTYGDWWTVTHPPYSHSWGSFRSSWYWNCIGGNTDCVDSWWERCEYATYGGDSSWINTYVNPYSIDNFDGSEITSITFDIIRDPACVPDNQGRCESDIQRTRECMEYDYVNDECLEYETCAGGVCEIVDWEFIPTTIKVDGLCSPTVWYDTVGKHFTCNGDTIHDGQFDCMDCRNIKKIRGCLDPGALNYNETQAVDWCNLSIDGLDYSGCKEPSKHCEGGQVGQLYGWVSGDNFDAGANQCDYDEYTSDIIPDAYNDFPDMMSDYGCTSVWSVGDLENQLAHGCRGINASNPSDGSSLGFCLYDVKCDGTICTDQNGNGVLCDDYGFDGCGVCGGDNSSCENICNRNVSFSSMLLAGGNEFIDENWNCPIINSQSPGGYQNKYNFTIPAGYDGIKFKAETCDSTATTYRTHIALYNSDNSLITNTMFG